MNHKIRVLSLVTLLMFICFKTHSQENDINSDKKYIEILIVMTERNKTELKLLKLEKELSSLKESNPEIFNEILKSSEKEKELGFLSTERLEKELEAIKSNNS